MTAAALLQALFGAACLFLPASLGGDSISAGPVIQLLGAALLGFAALNWLSRGAPLGGIYGRPVVLANFANAAIGTLLLGKAAWGQPGSLPIWTMLIPYALGALAFGHRLFFAQPKGPA